MLSQSTLLKSVWFKFWMMHSKLKWMHPAKFKHCILFQQYIRTSGVRSATLPPCVHFKKRWKLICRQLYKIHVVYLSPTMGLSQTCTTLNSASGLWSLLTQTQCACVCVSVYAHVFPVSGTIHLFSLKNIGPDKQPQLNKADIWPLTGMRVRMLSWWSERQRILARVSGSSAVSL